jgi:hypothetical protein
MIKSLRQLRFALAEVFVEGGSIDATLVFLAKQVLNNGPPIGKLVGSKMDMFTREPISTPFKSVVYEIIADV